MVEDTLDEQAFRAVKDLSVGQFREWLLDTKTTGATIRSISPGLTPEMAAAVCKLMSNMDLMTAGAKCQVVVRANNTLGLPGRLSSRLQPNHPTDDVAGHPLQHARGPVVRLRRRRDRGEPRDRHRRVAPPRS
jgi:ethanolamine ammonia-lyase large subunit